MRVALRILVFGSMLALATSGMADAPVSLQDEPFASFDHKLESFSDQPTETGLRDLNVLCLRLPVRDKLPNQIGAGHPLDRKNKLTCMLRFIAVLDRVITAVAASIASAPAPVMRSGDNPSDNSLMIVKTNFQVHLERVREKWAVREIPGFINDECRNCDPLQMRGIARVELKSDPDGPELIDALSRKIDAR